MSYKLRATNLQNVSAGNTASMKLPTGKNAGTLDKVILELSGVGFLPSHIESIRGKANGKLFWDESTGTIMNLRDDYRGVFTSASFLTLDFTEKNARNGAVEQLISAIPMGMLQDLTFEIKLAQAAPVTARLDAQMVIRQPTQNPFILKKLNTTQGFVAGGEQIMYLPVGGAGGKLKRIWIHESTPGNITQVDIRVGNTTAYETNRAKLEHSQKQNNLVPQAGIVVIDFVEDGNLSGVLDTGNAANVELRITGTAGDNYQVFYEFIDPIARL